MIEKIDFVEPPRLEWHNLRPFALARLPAGYAHRLEALAHQHEPAILALPVSPGWEASAQENPTGARFAHYNALLLDPAFEPLRQALRLLYRFLLESIGAPAKPRHVRSWCNIHRSGQRLGRHLHEVPYIGTFSAHAEGSTTCYGATPDAGPADWSMPHADGQLMVTVGHNHFHQVSVWTDAFRPRVTFAFDIVQLDAERAARNPCFVPLDDAVERYPAS